jgi:hypothetical protein
MPNQFTTGGSSPIPPGMKPVVYEDGSKGFVPVPQYVPTVGTVLPPPPPPQAPPPSWSPPGYPVPPPIPGMQPWMSAPGGYFPPPGMVFPYEPLPTPPPPPSGLYGGGPTTPLVPAFVGDQPWNFPAAAPPQAGLFGAVPRDFPGGFLDMLMGYWGYAEPRDLGPWWREGPYHGTDDASMFPYLPGPGSGGLREAPLPSPLPNPRQLGPYGPAHPTVLSGPPDPGYLWPGYNQR